MATSEQLAREAAATRARLSDTIDELRIAATPSHLIDGMTGYLRETGETVIDRAGSARRSRYTIPLALLGAGLTWLVLEARRAEEAKAARRRQLARERAADEAAVLPASEVEVVAPADAAAPVAFDPDLEAMDRAVHRKDAVEPVRSSADMVEPLPVKPEHGRSLAAVESVTIAPRAPDDTVGEGAEERRSAGQRSLPL